MKTQNEGSEIRGKSTEGDAKGPGRMLLVGSAVIATVLLVAVAGAMMFGCGSHESGTSSSSSASAPSAEPSAQASEAVTAAATIPAAPGGAPASPKVVREGLPPDLTVSVEDTLVTPGEAVEFLVEGTPDVTEVTLSDGRDEPLPLVRDEGKDTWRVMYRVPLHPRYERFGVSITAKNAANRWRRSWVFLHVGTDDSTGQCEEPVDNPDEGHDGR